MSTYSNDPQQNKWEMWFIVSVITFLSLLFICTDTFMYWELFTISFISLIMSIIWGCKN